MNLKQKHLETLITGSWKPCILKFYRDYGRNPSNNALPIFYYKLHSDFSKDFINLLSNWSSFRIVDSWSWWYTYLKKCFCKKCLREKCLPSWDILHRSMEIKYQWHRQDFSGGTPGQLKASTHQPGSWGRQPPEW